MVTGNLTDEMPHALSNRDDLRYLSFFKTSHVIHPCPLKLESPSLSLIWSIFNPLQEVSRGVSFPAEFKEWTFPIKCPNENKGRKLIQFFRNGPSSVKVLMLSLGTQFHQWVESLVASSTLVNMPKHQRWCLTPQKIVPEWSFSPILWKSGSPQNSDKSIYCWNCYAPYW